MPDFVSEQATSPESGDASTRIRRYYDDLADDYHASVADWDGAIRRQGRALAEIIEKEIGGPADVLDCAVGIGTQALGLAMRGYRVHGSDVSSRAIQRAATEARRRGVAPTFQLADMRSLRRQVRGRFDVVICCDNSLAHILTLEDLASAINGMATKLRPGGLVLVSLRDYDRHRSARPRGTGPVIAEDGTRLAFQQWTWLDDCTYESRLFVLEHARQQWQVRVFEGATSRAWTREELDSQVAAAGAADVRWELPPEGAYHQPILIARWPL